MTKLLIPGAITATLLLWQQMWIHAAAFAAIYVLLFEIARRAWRHEERFGDMEKIREAKAALRKAHESMRGGK